MNLFTPILKRRAARLAWQLHAFVPSYSKVLDVGCGDLMVGEAVQRLRRDVSWHGADVLKYHRSRIPFTLVDSGGTLPFKTGAFDVVVCAFVFHHCRRYEPLLSECLRVGSGRLIIIEDIIRESISCLLATWLHDLVVNRLVEKSIRCPGNFNTQEGWVRLLRQHGYAPTWSQAIKTNALAPVKQMLFVFDKDNHNHEHSH